MIIKVPCAERWFTELLPSPTPRSREDPPRNGAGASPEVPGEGPGERQDPGGLWVSEDLVCHLCPTEYRTQRTRGQKAAEARGEGASRGKDRWHLGGGGEGNHSQLFRSARAHSAHRLLSSSPPPRPGLPWWSHSQGKSQSTRWPENLSPGKSYE